MNRLRQAASSFSTKSSSSEALLCELVQLNIIIIIMRSSVKDIQDNIAIISYKGRLEKGKILFRGIIIIQSFIHVNIV